MAGNTQYRSRFGDTTLTKVFVGGLAWETPNDLLRQYYEQFGEILEAVIITDKATGRSKGYGFVTFRDPESAARACLDPNPVIDGRRTNCNIASQGLPRPSPLGRAHLGGTYQGGTPLHSAQPYNRIPTQMQLRPPPAVYPPYGYMTYTATDFGYQPTFYNPQVPPQYQHYGHTFPSSRVGQAYGYAPMGYGMQSSPTTGLSFVPHVPRMQGPLTPSMPSSSSLAFVQYPQTRGFGGEASFVPSSSNSGRPFQLQSPPTRSIHNNSSGSQASQQQSPTEENNGTSETS